MGEEIDVSGRNAEVVELRSRHRDDMMISTHVLRSGPLGVRSPLDLA